MSSYLEISGLTKSFKNKEVIKEINLQIEEGEIFTILGESGAGKSTLLGCITGTIKPDKGTIYLNGKNINSLQTNQRNISTVFQNYSLFSNMTVEQNILFPLKARIRRNLLDIISGLFDSKEVKFHKNVDEMLSIVKLLKHSNKFPHELSGGEQQRVALARALIFNPSLLCFDEPLGSLDKNLKNEMQSEIRRLQQEFKKTFVYITHDQTEAFSVSDRIAILHQGKILQIGTPKELYNNPRNDFIAKFLGECNIFNITKVDSTNRIYQIMTEEGIILKTRKAPDSNTVLGIRPDKLQITSEEPESYLYIKGKILSKLFINGCHRFEVELSPNKNIIVVNPEIGYKDNLNLNSVVYLSYNTDSILSLRKIDIDNIKLKKELL